ncbi:unnamed protein product [[Candida] boidinii]|uniref:mRNA-capping enzyme subunit beta n=1 Tax=Candida boidinii TaxID=5477 RepID=A0A9W6WEI1_CANBO|nr:hypothetical protein B5S30_g3351 [[Candida] boidinii]OWB84487.1 hypothetical protein B5S33_g3134 [[Candida] boidinii]GME68107.1 unnamed protein product [[Candida] boidinii]
MDLSLISNPVDDSPKDDKSDASEEQQQQQINAVPAPLPVSVAPSASTSAVPSIPPSSISPTSTIQTATPLTTRSNSQPRLSIHNLMNSDSTNKQNDVPQSQSQSTPVPLPQTQSAFGTNNLEIRKRSCISNLTNNDDVDIEGNKIPNAISRVSVVSSESNNIHNNNIDISPSSKSVNSENNDLDNQINDNHNDNTHPRSLHKKIKELEDIEKTEKIKSSKPKRYTVKPIWARDFIPEFSKHKDSNNQQYKHNNNDYNTQTTENSMNNIDSNNSSSPTFSKSRPPINTKLKTPSLTGTIPRNDFNRVITEWIWANIEAVKQDYQDIENPEQYIELELKLGNIWEKVKDKRLQLPINSETILSLEFFHQECFFKSGIPFQQFHDIKTFLSQLMESRNTSKNKQFVVENTHMIDLIASEKQRNDKPISGRVSLDIKTQRKMSSIQKQKIADLIIYLPNSLFDLRLTMALELPYELNDNAYQTFKSKVTFEREKERTSFIHSPTFTRIDLTKIRETHNNPNQPQQVSKRRPEPKYELELEINTKELLNSIESLSDDPLYFIDLVQSFLDNGRILARQLSVQM